MTEKRTDRSAASGAAKPAPRVLHEDRYRMLGLDFALATDSGEVRDFFRAAYRRFQVRDARPAALSLEAVMDSARGGPYVSVAGRRFDLSGPMPGNRAFLYLLNALMDSVGDCFLIHGASLRVGGRGLILAGRPGAGKSTLALEMARRGATLLSDDVAALSRAGGRIRPFPRAIGIRRDGSATSGFEPAKAGPGACHALPHKWLVDPEALGIEVAGPDAPDCPLDAVVLLEDHDPPTRRDMEIALADHEEAVLETLRSIEGVSQVRPVQADYPLYRFTIGEVGHPMKALSALLRDRADVVLYVDEARPERIVREQEPRLSRVPSSEVLMPIAGELLNRGESGELMALCGGLVGLVQELAKHLGKARAFRLRPGSPEKTAALVMDLMESDDNGRGEVVR